MLFRAFFYTSITQKGYKYSVIGILTMVVMLIVSCFIINLRVVPNELRLYSSTTPSFKAYDEMTWEYPIGLVNPYYVLHSIPDSSNSTVFSEENFIHDFEFIQKIISRFKTHTTLPPT